VQRVSGGLGILGAGQRQQLAALEDRRALGVPADRRDGDAVAAEHQPDAALRHCALLKQSEHTTLHAAQVL
jgi:hypothetical protein